MKKKIIGILVCMLLIATAVLSVGVISNNIDRNKKLKYQCQMKGPDDWHEIQKLLASDGDLAEYFGYSVSVAGDYAVIGSYYGNKTYFFERSKNVWTEVKRFYGPPNSRTHGSSATIDGDYAFVGDPNAEISHLEVGQVVVYHRDESQGWEQTNIITPNTLESNLNFGESVSIDGDYAVIGIPCADIYASSDGAAVICKHFSTGWGKSQLIYPADGQSDLDNFGHSVSIDGDYAVIGAPYDDENGDNSGSAYIFNRSGSNWTEQAKLLSSDGEYYDEFGCSVSIDGDYAVIGAPYDDDNGANSGSVYVFKRDGTSWTQEAKLLASDGEYNDEFGWSVSIDGDYVLVGAYMDEFARGSVYVFKRDGSTWIEEQKLQASDAWVWDNFGRSVSIDGYTAFICALNDDDLGESSGSAYVFNKNQPPGLPIIDGPSSGKAGVIYEYTFTTTDPNYDQIYYYVDWGDTSVQDWFGTFDSGEDATASHSWSKGNYEIRVKAKDIHGAETEWSDPFPISILRSKLLPNSFFIRLLRSYPNVFPILRHILGL